MGFANTVAYPPESHAGIVVARLPNALPQREVFRELLDVPGHLTGTDLTGALVIVEAGRSRLRLGPTRPM